MRFLKIWSIVILLLFAKNIAFSQIHGAIGFHSSTFYLKSSDPRDYSNNDIRPIGMRVFLGYEDVKGFVLQYDMYTNDVSSGNFAVGYRPFYKTPTRFQPMVYTKLGMIMYGKESKVHLLIGSEIHLDYYVGRTKSLGIAFGYNWIPSKNFEYGFDAKVNGILHIGLMYKFIMGV